MARQQVVTIAVLGLLGACGKKHAGPPIGEFVKSHAAKIDAVRTNLRRAVANAAAPASASAPNDCSALHLSLNGKKHPGNAEVLWADEADDVLSGKFLNPTEDRHLVARPQIAGYCQLLPTSMFWLTDSETNEIFASGVSPKVGGWIDSALDLTYVIVLVPGEHDRGEQKVELRAVELASGDVKCSVEVAGHADPSLGVEYYQLVRKGTGEKVGGVQATDKYSLAMRDDLQVQLPTGLSRLMHVDMSANCAHPD